jgi:hypothetical protein
MAKLRIHKLVPMLVAVAFVSASLLVVAEPASAVSALFRVKRTWWFSQAGSWTSGTVVPNTPTASAQGQIGSVTPNPSFTAPRSFIKNTTYTFMCGPGTFQCYVGYPNSSGWYSYWNAKGSFQKSNPYAPTTTTTVRARTVSDGYDASLMGWASHTTIIETLMSMTSRTVTLPIQPPTAMFTRITPTEGGCTGVLTGTMPDCPGTTQFGGDYKGSRGGSIMITPGGNRFGGTMRYFDGPNAFYYQLITIDGPYTAVSWPPLPTSQQNGTGDPFQVGSVSSPVSSIGLRYQLTENPGGAHSYRYILGDTATGSVACSPVASGSLTMGGTVRPPTNAGCQYLQKTVRYIQTRAPYTTGMVQQWQPNGNTNTVQTTTGYDNRTAMGLNGTISMVNPRLVHAYLRDQVINPLNPIKMSWSSARLRKMDFMFAPEPAGVAMLAAGFVTLAGLVRLRRR